MNAMWECPPHDLKDNPDTCVEIYNIMQKCIELSPDGEDGKELDEFHAHRLMESFGSAMTVQEMRQALATIDIDFNRQVSLSEYLIHRYKVDWHFLVVAQASGKSAKLVLAQRHLEHAKSKLSAAKEAEDTARAEVEAAVEAKAQAVEEEKLAAAAVEESKTATQEVEVAQAQQTAAVAELHAKEKEREDMLSGLRAKAEDASLSVVKRNKAKAELAQAEQQEQMPLQRAKIEQEASLRKVNKALKHASEAEAASAAAAHRAEEAVAKAGRVHGRANRAAAEAQERTEEAEASFKETAAALEEAIAENAGNEGGTLWILDYELEEAKKRMPRHRVQQLQAEAAKMRAELTGA
eukprot:scaffold1778_cov246-Pinguiococcus_pyrenoidosus.AAC.17